ncbi:MAG: hypothetical protein RL367_564 [Pseudomonadota bacterium]|jgi:tRNA threonylcarbamoyl adenosine modification protein YeaZ
MRLLVIETTGQACSVALFDGEDLVAARHEDIRRGHGEALIPWIADLPQGGRADSILVGCGPGSFTGVRIGIAAARALGLGWGVPVTGCSSLALLAAGFAAPDSFLVAIEGGHGELFVQSFTVEPLAMASPLQSLTPAAAAAQFAVPLVVGSGAEQLVAARGSGIAHRGQACAANAVMLGGDHRNLEPSPIYGRAVDARPMV